MGSINKIVNSAKPKRAPAQREVGMRLRQLRQDAGISRHQMAKMIHCSSSLISHYEQGTRNISAESKVQLARVFGITIVKLHELLYGEDFSVGDNDGY